MTLPSPAAASAQALLARLSLNQATIKRASLAEAVDACVHAGIGSIGLWREPVADAGGAAAAARMVADAGLRVSSLCRGGFFTGGAESAARDDNMRAIDESAELAMPGGAPPVLILVVGGLPDGSKDLPGARRRVLDAIGEIAPYAASAGVRLGIEPLHPMFAADRAVVSTLSQALDIAEHFDAETVGVVVDTYHIWWDPDVLEQIHRAGVGGRVASYQVSDWITPLPADVLLGRGLMGDGHIDFGPLTRAVAEAGYRGDIEVEIFNEAIWATDPRAVARTVIERFSRYVGRE